MLRNGRWRAGSAVAKAVDPLPPRDHWMAVEMLSGAQGMHIFTARHALPERPEEVVFSDPAWLDFVLHRAPGLGKTGKGRFQRNAPKVLNALGEHPSEGGPVQVLEGRYGPYVTHNKVNATVPRGKDPASLTMDEAVALIAERIANGGGKKSKASRSAKPKAAKAAKPAKEETAAPAKRKAANQAAAKKPAAAKPAAKKLAKAKA